MKPVPPAPIPPVTVRPYDRGRQFPGRRLLLGFMALGLLMSAGWWAVSWVPLPPGLAAGATIATGMELQDRHGTPLRRVANADGLAGRPLTEAEIPPGMIWATLAAEDARFFHHPGVDGLATLRAAGQWVRHRRVISGASTITQQLIKLAEPRPRTLRTKLIEAAQALRLERDWDKHQLLREYLQRIDYGNGCAGLISAAQVYFGKRPADLSWAEAAFLAGLPQAPTRLNPRRHYTAAKARQEWILRRCRDLGWLSTTEYATAKAATVTLIPASREFQAPHFVTWLQSQPTWNQFARSPGAHRTTLDLRLQHYCEQQVARQLHELESFRVGNAAVVVIENRTGELRVMVGSGDWSHPAHGQVNGTVRPRSPGSALKPFTYLLALTDGATAADVIPDVPTEFATATGVFQPLNYDRHFRGPVSFREALANSLNVPAVRLLAAHGGPARLQSLLQQCGLTTLERRAEDYGLGLTLGNAEVRLLELANAYATLARLGEWRPIASWADPRFAPSPGTRIADPAACWLVADILSDPAARAAAFGLETPLRWNFPVACKTGTSSGFRDNWAFGYNPEFTVGVWVGNFDGTPMEKVSGVVGAGPLLHAIWEELAAQNPTSWYAQPESVRREWVEPLTGHRVAASTPGARSEWFLEGHLPAPAGPGDYDPRGRVRLSPEYAHWATTSDQRWGNRIAVSAPEKSTPGSLQILSPLPGTVLFFDADLPATAQRYPLHASAPCRWRCPSLPVEEHQGQTRIGLVPGKHHLEALDAEGGVQAETWIEIRRL